MIHYDRERYNCAHHAVKRLNELHGLDIKFDSGLEWYPAFIRFLRDQMIKIDYPQEGCLVVMANFDDSLHLGVFNNWHVEHNYDGFENSGCVIKSDIGTIRSEFKRIRFYAPSQTLQR